MGSVLIGFAIVGVVIFVGYFLGRTGAITQEGSVVLTRVAVTVGTPALLFSTIAQADLHLIVSLPLAIAAMSIAAMMLLGLLICWRLKFAKDRSLFVALCGSYVNAGNLGIPIATYVLGDATLVAPIVLLQQMIIMPVSLAIFDSWSAAHVHSLRRRIAKSLTQPLVLASVAGIVVSATGVTLPPTVYAPFDLLGQLAVPGVLLAYGVSLHTTKLNLRGIDARGAIIGFALKSVGQPIAAWAIAFLGFGITGHALFAIVVLSALPGAQNLYAYAQRYNLYPSMVRDSITLSTIASVPVIMAISVLLH